MINDDCNPNHQKIADKIRLSFPQKKNHSQSPVPKEQNLQLDINLSGKKLLSFYWIFSPLSFSLKLNFYFIFCLTLLPPLFDILPEKIITNRLLSLLLFLFYVKFYFPIQTCSTPRLPQRNFLLRKKEDNRLSTFLLAFFCVQDTKNLVLLKLSIVDQIIAKAVHHSILLLASLVTLMMRIMVEGVNMH